MVGEVTRAMSGDREGIVATGCDGCFSEPIRCQELLGVVGQKVGSQCRVASLREQSKMVRVISANAGIPQRAVKKTLGPCFRGDEKILVHKSLLGCGTTRVPALHGRPTGAGEKQCFLDSLRRAASADS